MADAAASGRNRLRLGEHSAYPWRTSSFAGWSAHARGYAFLDGMLLRAAELSRRLCEEAPQGDLPHFVSRLNGSFALVCENDDSVFAAVDRLRSLPLFFRYREGRLFLSDEAAALLDDSEPTAVDCRSLAHVLRTGFTLGGATLIEGISQLQAGQFLLATTRGKSATALYYYQHLHQAAEAFDPVAFATSLEALSDQVFQRLVSVLDGRTCVVPLSGGYDSRYILAMLRRLNYQRVVTYTYGGRRSTDVAIARRVAMTLGYSWHAVRYDRNVWRRFLSAAAPKRYMTLAGNNASLPHIQDLPALLSLTADGVIPGDAVFIPGFCGDVLGGSFLPAEVALGQSESLMTRGLADYIYGRHMVLANTLAEHAEALLKQDVAESCTDFPIPVDIETFVSSNEAWVMTHRISKFIVNSLRVYEFFDHEWLMPLWDNELCAAWYGVPSAHRVDGRLYDQFLLRWLFAPLGVAFEKTPPLKSQWPFSWLQDHLPVELFASLRSSYLRVKSQLRPDDPNDFLELARQIRGVARAQGLIIGKSRNVNQALAPFLLRDYCSEMGQRIVFDSVYAGPKGAE